MRFADAESTGGAKVEGGEYKNRRVAVLGSLLGIGGLFLAYHAERVPISGEACEASGCSSLVFIHTCTTLRPAIFAILVLSLDAILILSRSLSDICV